MNPILAELLHGAGLSDIVIPRNKFVKEHRNLIKLLNSSDDPALQKEAKDQSEELKLMGGTHRDDVLRRYKLEDKPYSIQKLSDISSVPVNILQEVYNRCIGAYSNLKSVRLKGSYVKNVDAPASKKLSKEQWAMARVYSFLNGNEKHDNDLRRNTGGFTKSSGFIRRLMAENIVKHQGQYKNPTYPLHPDSIMNKPAQFDYKKLANSDQSGSNANEYGASPFIQKHFGTVRAVPFERKRGEPYPTGPFSKRKSKKITQESKEQKEARRSFQAEAQSDQKVDTEVQPEQEVEEKHSDVAEAKEEKRVEVKEEPEIASSAFAKPERKIEIPKDIWSLSKINDQISKINEGKNRITWLFDSPEIKKYANKLFTSMRFHLMNGENVRKLDDLFGFRYWIREKYGAEEELEDAFGEDGWALLYEYGNFKNGKWELEDFTLEE